ncbi:ADP-ribose glycohydrolase MACROD1-like isoform X2 [Heptranchias perlo]|uniref:ADP-ribose glycohydrolase MACROD1-like isoform X2 n=1 Tax=Heptranchias perlo TaxID=212740 RepID=UPI00355A0EFC
MLLQSKPMEKLFALRSRSWSAVWNGRPLVVSARARRPTSSNAFQSQPSRGSAPARSLLSVGRRRRRHSLPSSGAPACGLSTSFASMTSKEFNPTYPTTDWKVAKKHLEEIDQTEKRIYYKAERFVTLDEIQTWKDFAEENKFKQLISHYAKDDVMNEKLSLLQEDITKLEIDVIVNAVDGCIHMAAGPLLRKECSTLGGCSPGDAKITSGYCLPAKYVIHTVGPFIQGKERLPEKELQSCYTKSLKLAEDNNLRTIAFPCVSTGIYGYPNGQAAETVLKTVREYLAEHSGSFDRIIFCVYVKIDYQLYKEKMPYYFPYDAVTPEPPKERPSTADKDEKQTEKMLKLGNKQGVKSQNQL